MFLWNRPPLYFLVPCYSPVYTGGCYLSVEQFLYVLASMIFILGVLIVGALIGALLWGLVSVLVGI